MHTRKFKIKTSVQKYDVRTLHLVGFGRALHHCVLDDAKTPAASRTVDLQHLRRKIYVSHRSGPRYRAW